MRNFYAEMGIRMCQYTKAFKTAALGLLRGSLDDDKDLKEYFTKNLSQDRYFEPNRSLKEHNCKV